MREELTGGELDRLGLDEGKVAVADDLARQHTLTVELTHPRGRVPSGHRLHEAIRQTNTHVKVLEVTLAVLAVNELEDVRVVDAHDAHVGTVAVLLLDHTKGGVVHVEEGDRTAGLSETGLGGGARRTHQMQREAETTAGLLKHGSVGKSAENRFHGVLDVQHDAVGHQRGGCTGVGERATGRSELKVAHHRVELISKLRHLLLAGTVLRLHRGETVGDTTEHVLRSFQQLARGVTQQVAFGNHL
mmetsp:Transcript_401/g.932  ORF Transcript_401/g.932 Transcript_401/m.932 type:complete len:245 (+) Transcript_401:1624-2358(+)